MPWKLIRHNIWQIHIINKGKVAPGITFTLAVKLSVSQLTLNGSINFRIDIQCTTKVQIQKCPKNWESKVHFFSIFDVTENRIFLIENVISGQRVPRTCKKNTSEFCQHLWLVTVCLSSNWCFWRTRSRKWKP